MRKNVLVFFFLLTAGMLNAQTIYSNGPYVNSPGTGAGGADESVLQTTSFGMSTIGFGQQANSFNRVADDFTISDCRWRIDSIAVFGYQTGATTVSTFTGYNIRIWDTVPDAVGSSVVFGDTVTNRMIRTEWSGAYRITETTVGNSTRPIMRSVLDFGGVELNSGTYWFDWAATGSLASGPWQVPITIFGQPVTGNGRQRIGGVWNNLIDGGTNTPAQGLPFVIYGTVYNATADAGADQMNCEQFVVTLGGTPAGTGTGPLLYDWTTNLAVSDSAVANPTFILTDTLQAVLQVTDSLGCIATDTAFITPYPSFPVAIDTIGTAVFCEGGSVQLTTDMAGGLVWSTAEVSDTITVATSGLYDVEFTDINGCVTTDSITVQVNPLPVVSGGSDVTTCAGNDVTVSGSGASTYNWDNGITDNVSFVATTDLVLVVTGTDVNGCEDSDTVAVTVNEPSDTTITVTGIDSYTLNGQTYTADGTYQQTITNAAGCDSVITIVLDLDFTGLNEWGIQASLYPNPATDVLFIQATGLLNDRFSIVDLSGRIVAEGMLIESSAHIAVSGLIPGHYLVRFADTPLTIPFIKN